MQPAAHYPPALCHDILQGLAAQRRREGQVRPCSIAERMHEGRGVHCLEEERPEFRELAALARDAQDRMDRGELKDLDEDDAFLGYLGAGCGGRADLGRLSDPGPRRPRPVRSDNNIASIDTSSDEDYMDECDEMIGIDDVSGESIPSELVEAARMEEVKFMQSWGYGNFGLPPRPGLAPGRGLSAAAG